MSTHTSGPWTVDKYGVVMGDKGSTTIAEVSVSDWHDSVEYARQKGDNATMLWAIECRARAEANARLIAAAPDLLEAVRMVLDAATEDGHELSDSEICHAIDWQQLRAAIAKAEGGEA